MAAVFPIAKKYGAMVVGMTMDEGGIPETAQGRYEIALRILQAAETYGLPKEDILIDCLAQAGGGPATLEALRLVKGLGVGTTLGISNVSLGRPNRDALNAAFLAEALEAGLDAPIMDPASNTAMEVVRARQASLCKAE
jgi:5-methyltetrahydrofolate--homocysteine methyltransferase